MTEIRDIRLNPDLFAGSARLTMEEALELTVMSLNAHAKEHRHWAVAWSGGKDSTATLTLLLHLIETGRVARPESLTVLYADTRQELPPLAAAAEQLMAAIQHRSNWVRVEVARAPLDKRFLVYMLGRGVPPPNNTTLRWCTRQIKVDPMASALERLLSGTEGSILTITGVRQGESAIRDRRIEMSCGRDGAECGQGWYQKVLPNARGVRGRIATLAPLLHWRVCHVWEWLRIYAPAPEFGAYPTRLLAEAYGGEEAEEVNARTGCVGCPLASKDRALETLLRRPEWAHLTPLLRLKPLYVELRRPERRLRQPGAEYRKDGTMVPNPQRLGPLALETRAWALEQVLAIQRECNEGAATGRLGIELLTREEEARIRELIAAGTWPEGWTGEEPTGDVLLDEVFRDGSVQPLLLRVAD
jgi:DNA sulfur modification protein DndC